MGIAAVGAVRVNDCHRIGQLILALVVVGDDQIHAQLPAQLRFFHGGNTAVHGDNELYALLVQLLQVAVMPSTS